MSDTHDDNLNRSFYEDVAEQLYNLDRQELRKLAYEALLISDGPDHITGSIGGDFQIYVTRSIETIDHEPKLFTIGLVGEPNG